MHWIVNVMSDVTSTSASVFEYPTTVTLPVMTRLKASEYLQHSISPVVLGKKLFKVQYTHCGCPVPDHSIGKQLSKLIKLYSPLPHLLPFDRPDLLSATHPSDHNAVRFTPASACNQLGTLCANGHEEEEGSVELP
jgi:hypothetical protein